MEHERTIRRSDRAVDAPVVPKIALRKPLAGDVPVAEAIRPLVVEGELYEKLPDDVVHCFACAHHCRIKPGARGICQVRYNLEGRLYVPYGYVAALQCDPIEKKPFHHVYPGTDALTFGMLGCNLHCTYCQNWNISQALRDANAGERPVEITPERLVQLAGQMGARCFASSYNEPLITSEWAMAVFRAARAAGYICLYVSSGNATRGVLEYIRPYVDGYKIDLKSMSDRNYRTLGAVLEHVLDGIRMVHALGFWEEIVTLVVPGFNDSEAELKDAAQFIASVSPDIPWHVTAFHQDYHMQDKANTDAAALVRAAEIGYAAGLHFVYAGNLPGQVGAFEHTYCPACHETLIERLGYVVMGYHLTADGRCPACGAAIPGIWPDAPEDVRLGSALDLFARRPRPVRQAI
ncbi:MAG TPA: AmmeMemoRadiSam system radical SAM enzyme [Anaerolineae bacterium]